MSTTPEGAVKKKVKEVLKEYKVYYLMPVQMGRGAAGLDFHCCVKVSLPGNLRFSLAFFVETKDYGEPTTTRQDLFIADRLKDQFAKTFVVDDDKSLKVLEVWLYKITQLGVIPNSG